MKVDIKFNSSRAPGLEKRKRNEWIALGELLRRKLGLDWPKLSIGERSSTRLQRRDNNYQRIARFTIINQLFRHDAKLFCHIHHAFRAEIQSFGLTLNYVVIIGVRALRETSTRGTQRPQKR